ncbi:hypothetical protein ACHQM5_026627 [Ranunculus cassubicifolius]
MGTLSTSFRRSLKSSIVLVIILLCPLAVQSLMNSPKYNRADFPLPPKFVFGSGTSAYQVEGAVAEDGRTPSIWDTVAHQGKPLENGDIACDQYHRYKEDVQLMVDTGLEAYRFSISWSRLIPNGRGPVNPKGLQYYNNLINELINHGIQPHVTLFHYDLPQVLEDEYGGWLSRKVVIDFEAYADVCFREFGDRVLHWTTINEANVFILGGYDVGIFPPARCSTPFGYINCKRGNSTTEPYIAAHNCLLAHASAANLYKTKYQNKQRGFIGLNIFAYWFNPLTNSTKDIVATQRANDFYIGWFIDPLVFGDYPAIVKKNAGSKIQSFSKQESDQLMKSYDFIGLNHYTTVYVKDDSDSLDKNQRDALRDMGVELFSVSYSSGMQKSLEYFKHKYGNPPMYIHENGQMTPRTSLLNDTSRVAYLDGFIQSLLDAVRNGSNTWGYFSWSFLDLYELLDGYGSSFGLYFVDINDPDLKRYPKLSAHWYSNFLKGGSISNPGIIEAGNLKTSS